MPRLRSAVVFVTALVLAPAAVAGPVDFGFSTGNVRVLWSDKPGLDTLLQPFMPPGPIFDYTPGSNAPVRLPAVSVDPTRLAAPAPADLHWNADHTVGSTHVNVEGQFAVDVNVYDFASGESGSVTLFGTAHTYNQYRTDRGWMPTYTAGHPDAESTAWFWFVGTGSVTVGENVYTVRGANRATDGPAAVNVWVNDTPPVETPEPATLALGALGLVPLAVRRLRRRA